MSEKKSENLDPEAVCLPGPVNLNAIQPLVIINNLDSQATPNIDSQGDLWYSDNGTIKWATIKGGGDSGTGGDDGTGGTEATGGDAGTGGIDAGTGVEIPKGTTVYKVLSSGIFSENPDDFQTVPPVTEKLEEEAGCSVSGHVGSTRSDLSLLFSQLAIADVTRRRKKE